MPAKPAVFDPHGAPVGVEIRFVMFTATRAVMSAPPRLQLVHTNAASREGTIESSWNWAHARPGSNTLPHYQVDRDGRARKMLPTNRVGIANCTKAPKAQVRNWSLAYETADRGTSHPDGLGGFTPEQGETLAGILAYEAITHGIPLEYPDAWDGAGTACHTEPYYWSCVSGKSCPGEQKKREMREWVIPRARAIRAEWTAPPNPSDLEEAMYLATLDGGDVVVVGSAVRPVSAEELGSGALAALPSYKPSPASFWHRWLRAGADEYAKRLGMS